MTRSAVPPPAAPAGRARRTVAALWKRRAVRWTVDLLAAALIVMGVGAYQTRAHPRGRTLPAMTLTNLEGETVALSSLRGRPTLVAFWAPWCGVCKAESDNISRVRRMVGDRARVISVVLGYQNLEQVRAYVREHQVDYPVLLGNETLSHDLRIEAFPSAFFLDDEGRIDSSTVGYTTTSGLLLRLFL